MSVEQSVNKGSTEIDVVKLLDSIGVLDYSSYQRETLAMATKYTCLWFTESATLGVWIKKGKILWGTGIRG